MSERDTYPAGVPCWVTNLQRDVPKAVAFYEGVFGWDMESGPDDVVPYALGRVRGRDVAGIGSMPEDAAQPGWVTEIRVDDLPGAVHAVRDAGGEVLRDDLDFGSTGRLGVFVDPVGAVFCAWEGGDREGAQLVNEPGAWAMSALQTDAPDRAAEFYGAVFGWETEAFGPATLFRLPGYVGGEPSQPVARDVVAVMVPASSEAPAVWGVDFWIDDLDRALGAVRSLGGRVVVGPYDAPPAFRRAVVADCSGAAFTLSQKLVG